MAVTTLSDQESVSEDAFCGHPRPQEEEKDLVCEDAMEVKVSADICVNSFCGQEDNDPEDRDMAHFISGMKGPAIVSCSQHSHRLK